MKYPENGGPEIVALGHQIEQHLKALALPRHLPELYDPISYMLAIGGKRVRPLLVLLGAKLAGGEAAQAMPAALAVEIFHGFTLMHDDLMDESELRRGQQTVHKKWDTPTAILAGDAMLVVALQQLARSPVNTLALVERFNEVALRVCEGQQLDMLYAKRGPIKIEDYSEMIRLKTAVLLGGSLQLGAMAADAPLETADQLYHIGEDAGMAFQLMDDYLDTFGDTEKTGKEVGGDIRENKKTWLYLKALEVGDKEQAEDLKKLYHSKALADQVDKIEQVKAIFKDIGIDKQLLDLKDEYYGRAVKSCKDLPADDGAKSALLALLEGLSSRVH